MNKTLHHMDEQKARAFFLLAGIEVQAVFETANRYFPDNGFFIEVRAANPWWLMQTEFGIIRIGPRKRVISVDWDSTEIRLPDDLIPDDVTKGETYFHAYTAAKCVEYLTLMRKAMEGQKCQ